MQLEVSPTTPKLYLHTTSNLADNCEKFQDFEVFAPKEHVLHGSFGRHEEMNKDTRSAAGEYFTEDQDVDIEMNDTGGTWLNVYEDGNTNINPRRDRIVKNQFTRIESYRAIIGTVSLLILVIIALISINSINPAKVVIGVSIFGFLFILEMIFSNSFSFLLGTIEKEKADIFLNQIEAAAPLVRWQIRCYHWENKTRVLINDDGVKVIDTIRERVNTWSAKEFFKFTSWNGISTPPCELIKSRLTKVKLIKKFCFDNAATEAEFRRQKMAFQLANNRDTHLEISESLEIPGFEDVILCEDRKGCLSRFLNLPCYLFFI